MVSLFDTFQAGRLASLCGNGYFAGEAPASSDPDAPDGRARILNVPSRIRIGIYQRQTMLCVASTLSSPTGLWRVEGLDPNQHYTVIGFDNGATVNAAIQDWVKPEAYDPASLRRMHLVGVINGGSVGQPVSWRIRAAYAVGEVHFAVTAGALPPGWSLSEVESTCFVAGTSTTAGDYTFEITGTDTEERHASAVFHVEIRAGYTFWRVTITANNGNSSYATIAEMQMRADIGGPNKAVGGNATGSSAANSDNIPGYAFDNNFGTKWTPSARPTTGAPQWVQYEFADPVAVRQVALTGCISGQEDMAPRDFTIERSADGLEWETVASITGQTSWTGGETRLFELP